MIDPAALREQKALQELADAKKRKSKVSFTPEEIVLITDYSATHTNEQTCQWWKTTHPDRQVSADAVEKYGRVYRSTGAYFVPGTGGQKHLLTETEEKTLLTSFDYFRARGMRVDAELFARAARGICRRSRPYLFSTETNGHLAFTKEWARVTMLRLGLKVRRATTSRLVPAAEIVAAGKDYFSRLRDLQAAGGYDPRLILNTDEFFVLLDGDNKRWTWERADMKNVAIKDDRLGFTASVCSTMAGEVLAFQLIWKGSTPLCHARIEGGTENPLFMQTHREDSHFQNATTWKEWLAFIGAKLKALRVRCGLPAEARALFLYDAATQHGETAEYLKSFNCDSIECPPKMTHAFQPADMFVISNIKAFTRTAWTKWVEDQFALLPAAEAAKKVENLGTATQKKVQKYQMLSEAVIRLQPPSIQKSWATTGIPRAMGLPWDETTVVLFDQYQKLADLEASGEPASPQAQVPQHQEEEASAQAGAKRHAGRPPGSKNKKNKVEAPAATSGKQTTLLSFLRPKAAQPQPPS